MYRYEPGVTFRAGQRADFAARFERSRKGNLWRPYAGWALTIFERVTRPGWYSWCIADEDGPRFSREAYEGEEAALDALATYLRIGED
jgi:hypothetical protein